jgi:hypothetical protein
VSDLTFLYQMQHRKRKVVAYESSAQRKLEHSDGKHRVTRIVVRPLASLRSEKDIATAREAIKDTAELCMISNSILTAVQLDPRFEVSLASAKGEFLASTGIGNPLHSPECQIGISQQNFAQVVESVSV